MKLEAQDTRPGYYNQAGKRVPSVTTIAKLMQESEPLIAWANRIGLEGKDFRTVRDDAADAGHVCHGMVECYIRGQQFIPDPKIDEETLRLAQQGFKAFQIWANNSRFSLIHSEVAFVSEKYQYGGRLDCIASIGDVFSAEDELCIVDWKTSGHRRLYESWVPQVAAYRQGWNENHPGQRVKSCHLMILAKADAGFSHHYLPESTMDQGWKAFLACKELYDMKKVIGKLI